MTLQEISQLLGVIGVIASLIYVAIQIRNNARAVRAAAYQSLASAMANQWELLAINGDLSSIVSRGGADFSALDKQEKDRFRYALMAYFRKYESAWVQHKIGTLKEDDWQTIAFDIESICALPGMRTAWLLIRNRSNPKFRGYVDGVVELQAKAVVKDMPKA